MRKRILVALLAIPPVLATLYFAGRWAFAAVVALAAAGALYEYLRMCGIGRPLFAPTLALGALTVLSVPAGLLALAPFTGLLVLVAFSLGGAGSAAERFRGVVESAFGLGYIGFAMVCLLRLRELASGTSWIFLVLAATWAGDSAAYFVGTRFGRRRLAPVLSPKKTWEGAIAGLAGSVAAACLAFPLFPPSVPRAQLAVAGLVVGVSGQIGDLFESLWKRAKGVKDSGALFPGHGGILDRIDSLLLAFPVAYHLLRRWSP